MADVEDASELVLADRMAVSAEGVVEWKAALAVVAAASKVEVRTLDSLPHEDFASVVVAAIEAVPAHLVLVVFHYSAIAWGSNAVVFLWEVALGTSVVVASLLCVTV